MHPSSRRRRKPTTTRTYWSWSLQTTPSDFSCNDHMMCTAVALAQLGKHPSFTPPAMPHHPRCLRLFGVWRPRAVLTPLWRPRPTCIPKQGQSCCHQIQFFEFFESTHLKRHTVRARRVTHPTSRPACLKSRSTSCGKGHIPSDPLEPGRSNRDMATARAVAQDKRELQRGAMLVPRVSSSETSANTLCHGQVAQE